VPSNAIWLRRTTLNFWQADLPLPVFRDEETDVVAASSAAQAASSLIIAQTSAGLIL
jgi:hypothetical protein